VKDGNDREHSLQVLKHTNMTSVLVECGFLTNDKEAIYLNTTNGQDILASAIFRGFRSHITAEHPTIQFVKTEKKTEDKKDIEEEKSTTTASYQIQLSSSKEPIDPTSEAFKKTGLKVTRTKLNTTSTYKYRYTVGPYKDKAAAKKDLEIVQKNGFKDAMIITVN
jgi:N-acetylmuramoyl-L-alanine amidase